MYPGLLCSLVGHLARLSALSLLLTSGLCQAQIGMTDLRAGDLPVTLVYPTAAPSATRSFGPFELSVALNAMPRAGNGRLVVLSHGTGGDTLSLHTLAATLVRAGFVVAQPLHRGDNWQDASDRGPVSFARRPREVSAAIDAIAQDVRFAPLLQLDRVGLFGMSAGGITGLALAGADWSVATLMNHCAAHLVDDAGFCLYGARSAQEAAERAKAYSNPLPARAADLLGGALVHDARIAAVALAVPAASIVTASSLAAIRIPVGLVEADNDQILNPRLHSGYVLASCRTCSQIDAMSGAGHFDTLSPWPDTIAQAMARAPGGQRHPAIDDARRQQTYDAVSAFLSARLLP